MAESEEIDFNQDVMLAQEDQATLDAISEGLRQADEGQLISAEEVRERVAQWISRFSTRQGC